MKTKLDTFNVQEVINYFKNKSDFLNIIQVKKQFRFLLDKIRVNPIKITKETKNLFQCIETQQFFGIEKERSYYVETVIMKKDENEILLPNVKTIQVSCPIFYSQMKQLEENKLKNIDLKFKHVVYSQKDREKYGNEIPKEVNIIGAYCFVNCDIETIVIPTTITQIQSFSFSHCKNLKEIVIPDNVMDINHNCFENCTSLSKVILPSNLNNLDFSMFLGCSNLRIIQLSKNLEGIGDVCFDNCGIEEIKLPSLINEICSSIFANCNSLTKIDLSNYSQLFILCDEAFCGCTNLKEIIFNNQITDIYQKCFKDCYSLETVVVPSSVSLIDRKAFKNCHKLKELIVLNEKCSFGNHVFDGCTSLTKLQLPSINGYVLYNASENENEIFRKIQVKPINIYDWKKRKDYGSIELINIENIDFPMDNIDYWNTSLYVPSTVTSFDSRDVMENENLKELFLPSSIKNFKMFSIIRNYDNEHPSIKINFEDNRKTIDDIVNYYSFCLLLMNGIICRKILVYGKKQLNELPTSCDIVLNWSYDENKIKNIPSNAIGFNNLLFLDDSTTSLTIPAKVKKCKHTNTTPKEDLLPNLKELKCFKHHLANNNLIENLLFLTKIEIIDGSLNDIVVSYDYHLKMKEKGILLNNINYTLDDRKKYGNTIPEGIKSVENYSPKYYSLKDILERNIEIRSVNYDLENIEIPFYQSKIYKLNFSNSSQLSTIKLNDGIKEIDQKAFYKCISLKSLSIPSSVTLLNEKCFNECSSLTSIEYCEEMNGNCLKNCYSLQSIPVVKSLVPGNFYRYSYLTSIQLNDSIGKIPVSCFNQCLSLTSITIPSKCSELEMFAFKHCISLKEMNIPKNVIKINDGVFYGCGCLERVVIENEDIQIGYDAFGNCSSLKEIIIGDKKIDEYKFEVNYSQMKQFEELGMKCFDMVIRREDIKQYGIEILNDLRVHRIHDNCFRDNEQITEMIIPTHITKLGKYSFSNCSNLTKLDVPTSIKEIPHFCFEHCKKLIDVQLPESVSYQRKCFWKCKSLTLETKRFIKRKLKKQQKK